jgi:hypothetical protein
LIEPFAGAGDDMGPVPVAGEAEDLTAAGGDEVAGRAEQAEPQAAGFPYHRLYGPELQLRSCDDVEKPGFGLLGDFLPDRVERQTMTSVLAIDLVRPEDAAEGTNVVGRRKNVVAGGDYE